jgi:hypothetical protein
MVREKLVRFLRLLLLVRSQVEHAEVLHQTVVFYLDRLNSRLNSPILLVLVSHHLRSNLLTVNPLLWVWGRVTSLLVDTLFQLRLQFLIVLGQR